ncbi:hypothetical protein EVAR_22600_1 [Eumeta japonica]|uniref:FP protein C-terminal domain-containing protein n=1 Tax=Eumeta variegata TaxID=151549 RepID=A0A4C1U8Q6_EUMVA|nr:hypothetical protein EVAR_22600_1 [Eumeta japonica]
MNTWPDRPRNILVTLASPRLRDFVLSATLLFNKAHCKDMFNSKHVDFAGESRRIYIMEHLSHECKQLQAAARKHARENNYKYVWVWTGVLAKGRQRICFAN